MKELFQKFKWHLYIFYIVFFVLFLVLPFATKVHVQQGTPYYTKNEVSLYIMEYSELPKNFITKGESESLFDNHYIAIDYGFNIGGDVFRYEGPIVHKTSNTELTECDLYPNKEVGVSLYNRGPHRLVFVNDGSEVYYTEDHYLTFSRVTLLQIQKVSFLWWIVFALYNMFFGSLYFYLFKSKMITYNEFKTDINKASRYIFGFIGVFHIFSKYIHLVVKYIKRNI